MERWKELERQGRVKIGCEPPDHEGSSPEPDEYGDVDAEGQPYADVAGADWTLHVETRDADLLRFAAVTDEMREQNAAGIASGDVGKTVNYVDEPDDPPEPWPPAARHGNRDNVLSGHGLADAQP